MTVSVSIERVSIPLHEPLVITGHSFSHLNTVWVSLDREGVIGRGEGTGSYYLGETQDSIVEEIERITPALESGLTREELQEVLAPGGARNAVDCALWDLECKEAGQTIWERVGAIPHDLTTVASSWLHHAVIMAFNSSSTSKLPTILQMQYSYSYRT